MFFSSVLTPEDLQVHADALLEVHARFAPYFHMKTRDVSPHALAYLQGQLLCDSRRNMSKMATKVVPLNEQALFHFISTSPWEEAPLIEAIGREAVSLLGGEGAEGALILDESGVPKQGTSSGGVARQYCGALGKVDNCQVGVFLAYARGHQATLVDKRLYLPEAWTEDPERCEQAGIPEEVRTFHTRAELGLEMIRQAKARGLAFSYVSMDAHYGQQPWLLSALEEEGLEYVADLPCDTRVYLDYPQVGVPPRKGKRGRTPSVPRVLEGSPIQVRTLLDSEQLEWHVVKVRDTQRGALWIQFAALRVYRIEEELPVERPVWLLIRRELATGEGKFSFSTLPEETSIEGLAHRQSTRYWVERALEDAKGLAGLDEYQGLGWRSWHHHMSMVLLAMLFLADLRKRLAEKAPLLTLQDAKDILEVVMPKKQLSLEDAVKIIRKKHLNRLRARKSRLKRQKIPKTQ